MSRTKRAFEVKKKTFFLVSLVISFRHTNQTSKNVADTTFKKLCNLLLCNSATFMKVIYIYIYIKAWFPLRF